MDGESLNLLGRLNETSPLRESALRRETLNARFHILASLLPSLAKIRRPSQRVVVESAISFITNSREYRVLASRQLRALNAENHLLRAEVNSRRQRAGEPGLSEPRRGDAPELEAVAEGDEDESEERYTNGVFSRHRLRHQRSPSISQSSPPFKRRVSPLSSSSVLPSPASTPPSSTTFGRSIYGPTMAGGNSLYSLGSDLNNWLSPTSPAGYRNASQTSLDRFSEAESVGIQLDLTGSVTMLDTYPIGSGGSADVAIKIYRRMHSEPQELEQKSRTLYQAVQSWSALHHPNVLAFLGVSLYLGLSPALIAPLCPSGPIMKYLKMSTQDPPRRLQMTIGVAEGLEYLHSQGIIHGNLCTKKVLIDENGSPVICGYGMCNILGTSDSAAVFSSSIRFAAPEYFSDEPGTSSNRTRAGDVYSLSMVALEILSGMEPYHHLPTEHTVFKHILQGGQPIRTHLDHQVVTKRLWTFLCSLWDQDPSSRPAMANVVRALKTIRDDKGTKDDDGALDSPETTSRVKNEEKVSSAEETAFEIEVWSSEDRRVSEPLEFYGRDLNGCIKQDDQYPFAAGGNSNIYRGKLTRSDGRKIRVAIKMIRMSDDGSGQQEEMLRRLKREVEIWGRLKHKNILSFIGVCEDLAPLPVLISPFYKFGHVGKYINKHPAADRSDLVSHHVGMDNLLIVVGSWCCVGVAVPPRE
ncbi:kinase-like domain-containing protein [Mycena olivaceomarginata]|nr:kinase-like domain-containing protein [Mycena olivaceomarginata]